jgi:hypothetical protein
MKRRLLSPALLQVIAVITGCSGERIADPVPVSPGILTTIEVSPTISMLPGSRQLISIQAYDQRSSNMSWASSDVSYSSSNPAIVSVDSKGLVAGVAPGSADVRTTLTIKGVTLYGVTTVNVGAVPHAGRYTLVAPITEFYSPWGDYTCCRFTALIALESRNGLPGGTFSNFTIIKPDGSAENRGGGDVVGIDYKGQLMLRLVGEMTSFTGVITESEPDMFGGSFNFGDETAKGSFTLTLVGG